MEYIIASQSESIYSYPQQKIGLQIHVGIDRELTQEETWKIREYNNDIVKMLRTTSVKEDKTRQEEAREEKSKILACFGGRAVYVKEIPNGYDKDIITPWFLVTTSKGVIKIGWRKRVIEIDWAESDIKGKSEAIFASEVTTKEDKYVHAWGYSKAKEYIDKLLSL